MATLQVKVTDTADDGFFYGSGQTLATDEVYAGYDGADNNAFLRFLNVTIPQGNIISSATLTLNITNLVGTPDTTLYGADVDNAAAFDAGNKAAAVARTTASADPDPAGTGTKVITITSIVQEIVDRVGWASGNALALVVINNAVDGWNTWGAEDYQNAGTAEATLDITYTVPAVGGAAPRRVARYGYGYNYR